MPYSSGFYADLTKDQRVQQLAETDLSVRSCKARSGNLRCTLDAHHAAGLGTAHIAMGEGGALIPFRLEEKRVNRRKSFVSINEAESNRKAASNRRKVALEKSSE